MLFFIDNLEKRHLVKRFAHPTDRRMTMIHLTPSGKKLITQLMPIHVNKIVSALSALSIAEMRTLRQLCKKLGLPLKTSTTGVTHD